LQRERLEAQEINCFGPFEIKRCFKTTIGIPVDTSIFSERGYNLNKTNKVLRFQRIPSPKNSFLEVKEFKTRD
jgi:hypothetical protein